MWELFRGSSSSSSSAAATPAASTAITATAGAAASDRFTLASLGAHLDALDALPSRPTAVQSAAAVERLRALAEALCWGDQHESSEFFELFLERSGTRAFLRLLQTTEASAGPGPSLPAQVLQTLLLLVQNLRSRPALFCLFSNNHISHILSHPFDFRDEEVVALFVNFLRLISARLDDQVVHFFFMEKPPACPLMESAIPLFTHNEQLVRIAVRTTTLNIYRLRGSLVENYLTLATQDAFLDKVVNQAAAQARAVASAKSAVQLENAVDEFTDLILYANDLARFAPPEVSSALVTKIIHGLVEGMLLTSLLEEPYCPPESEKLPNAAALFLCGRVLWVSSHFSLVCQALELLGMVGEGTGKCNKSSGASLEQMQSLDASDNVYRKALLKQMSSPDPRVVVSAVGVFAAVLSNPDLPKALVEFKEFKSASAVANGAPALENSGGHEDLSGHSGCDETQGEMEEHNREKKLFGNVVDPVTEDLKHFFSEDVIDALIQTCTSACGSRISRGKSWEVLSVAQVQCAWTLSKVGSGVSAPISKFLASAAVDICDLIRTGPWADHIGTILEEEAEAAVEILNQRNEPPAVPQPLILLSSELESSDSSSTTAQANGTATQAEYLRTLCFTYALGKGVEACAAGKSPKSIKALFAQLPRKEPSPKPGQRLRLKDNPSLVAMGCKVSFERGKENNVFICHSSTNGDDVFLVEPVEAVSEIAEQRESQEGIIKFGAAICAAKPAVDARHPKWLHIGIRAPLGRRKNPGQSGHKIVDGRWTLSFPSAKLCQMAKDYIDTQADLCRQRIEAATRSILL